MAPSAMSQVESEMKRSAIEYPTKENRPENEAGSHSALDSYADLSLADG